MRGPKKTKEEFLEAASPILREAYRDGWFSPRVGLALAQFDFQTQHNIVAGLETGHISRNTLNWVAAFLWRLDRNEEPDFMGFIRFGKLIWRIGYFQEIFNLKVETCTYCQRTGYCGGMVYGEPLHGNHRMSLSRFGHRLY